MKKYEENKTSFRIIADHIRGSVFLISDGVFPSNTERGYILRRVIRRMLRYADILEMKNNFVPLIVEEVIKIYEKPYPEVALSKKEIISVIESEKEKFGKTLKKGLSELERVFSEEKLPEKIGKELFFIYQTYGLPLEMSLEEIEKKKISFSREKIEKSFKEEFKKHQEISRAGAEKKFGGVGDRDSYEAVKLHSATHLLHRALYNILGENVRQMGSDITKERLRFDFSYPSKLTEEDIKKVEDMVNLKIKEKLDVKKEKMSYNEAIEKGAFAYFKDKYEKEVTVYSIGDFSKEVCGGPHVENTSELTEFKIIKEESAGAGVRRIKATLNK